MKFIFLLLSIIGISIAAFGISEKNNNDLTLEAKIADTKKNSAAKIPEEKKKIMQEAIEKLRVSKITEGALKVGDHIPSFTLLSTKGAMVKLSSVLKNQSSVITFYRGSWCPYCRLQLNHYQKNIEKFKNKNVQLIAISPELPILSLKFKEKNALSFDILSDTDNLFAKKMGLVFGIPEELKKIYQEFGINLQESQGNPHWELPVAATYGVDAKGKITYAFVDVDYTKRAEVDDILKAF